MSEHLGTSIDSFAYPNGKAADFNDEVKDVYSFGEYHHAVMKDKFNETNLKQYLEQKAHKQIEIKKIEPKIEDRFMQLMKN